MPSRRKTRKRQPRTYFAPAARATPKALRAAVDAVTRNPVIDTLMRAFGGLVAVLNAERQILAVNHAFLQMLGIEDAHRALGLRPGEAAGCVHAADEPGGCGTSRYCSDCGAAIALVTAMKSGAPEDRECALSVRRNRKVMDIDFVVRCCPIEMGGWQLLLVLLRDVSEDKRRGALERTFFHDVNNLLTSLSVAGEMLGPAAGPDDVVMSLRRSINLLVREVGVQQALCRSDPGACPCWPEETSIRQVLDRIQAVYATHPAAEGKVLRLEGPRSDRRFTTDTGLLLRALMNMVTNALEATPPGQTAAIRAAAGRKAVTFSVWNGQAMAPGVARRVFQRYFTTKPGPGRGLGTFAMKWLTERYLKGTVDFTSTQAGGTTFRLRLPERV